MQQIVLELDGLTTPVKAAHLERMLRQKFGECNVRVDFVDALLLADPTSAEREGEMICFIHQQGVRVLTDRRSFQADIQISTDTEVNSRQVLDSLLKQPGIQQHFLDLASGHLRILHDGSFDPAQLVCQLEHKGLQARVRDREIYDRLRNLRDYCAVISTVMLFMGSVLDSLTVTWQEWAVVPFFIAMLASIWSLLEDGVIGAFYKRRLNYASVVLMFTMIAIFHHMWFEAAFVVTMFAIANFFERQFFRYIRSRMLALRQRLPLNAYVYRDQKAACVRAKDLAEGDMLCVRAGEYVAADGEIVDGGASFRGFNKLERNSGHLKAGDRVYAGWRLLDGEVQVRVVTEQAHSRWAVFLAGFHEAANSALPEWQSIRRWVVAFSTFCFSAGVFLIWATYSPLLEIPSSISMALALLLISGPAAITSTTQGRALLSLIFLAERGVLVKNGGIVSRLAHLKNLYFDKQGVITRGESHVEEVISLSGESVKSLLEVARSLVPRSSHDYFKAVVRRARKDRISAQSVVELESFGEQGYAGKINGQHYLFGTYRLMKEHGLVAHRISDRLERWQQDGVDVLFLASKDKIIGMFNVIDPLQEDIAFSVDGLHALDVSNLSLLTEDNEISSAKLAYRMGFDHVDAELSLEDKASKLQQVDNRRYTAVVSARDTVLDAEGLLKFSVRSLQRHTVYDMCDVAVLGNSLELLPETVTVASKTLTQLRNLSLIFISYKLMIIGAVLAAAIPLWGTMLCELIFIYCMWLASTRHGVLRWINPANQPKSIMQLPPPRKQRIFSAGLIR